LNSEILKTVLKLRFLLAKKSKRSFMGAYRSAFKGSGLTFSDFREYTDGDDVRSISWPLTAKMDKPYIKMFEEDRGSTFVLMVDVSASSAFGTQNYSKKEVIHQLASLLALATEQNHDQLSLLLFSDRTEHYVPPKKGRNHTLRIIRDIYNFKPQSRKTDLTEPFRHLENVLKKRCYIFLLSDFIMEDFEQPIRRLKHNHDVTAIIVRDPMEQNFPKLGLMDLEDMESGQKITVDSSSSYFQEQYCTMMKNHRKKTAQQLKKAGADYFHIQTNEDIFKPFIQFMQKKSKAH